MIEIDQAREYYAAAGGAHDFDHVLRVLRLAERVGSAEGADLQVVRTAALLHDIGEAEGREEHHLRGAEMAQQILAGAPEAFVEQVTHAIAAHRFRTSPEPRTLEARVLSDADRLDAIGAIGIARVYAYAGAHEGSLWRLPWREIAALGVAMPPNRAAGSGYTPSHEFVYKLDRIPERLYTATARAIAEERQRFMRMFFDRLDLEMAGEK